MKELKRAARKSGLSMQKFVEAAVFKAIAEEQERRDAKREERQGRDDFRSSYTESSNPPSLLIDTLRQRRQDAAPQPVHQPNTQGQVVVNVGGAGSGIPSSDIERLAMYVAAGSDLERESRLRTAVDVLRSSSTTDEERKVLAARLDEAIATKTKAPMQNSNEGEGVVRAARVTFDKIASLWKGF